MPRLAWMMYRETARATALAAAPAGAAVALPRDWTRITAFLKRRLAAVGEQRGERRPDRLAGVRARRGVAGLHAGTAAAVWRYATALLDEQPGRSSITLRNMTTPSIPGELEGLFSEPALAHVSYINGKGLIVSWPMWVDYDGEHLLISSPVGSRKGRSFRERGQVGISIVSPSNPWQWLSVSGRVVDIRPDGDLQFIDRMSQKYLGSDYSRRSAREVFAVAIDRVTTSGERLARWSGSS